MTMDAETGEALYDERITRSNEALAIEVVTLRAWYGSLLGAMDELHKHIESIAAQENGELILAKCAGGLGAVHLLKHWAEESMGTINDFTVTITDVD
jgi:hypothetical protein